MLVFIVRYIFDYESSFIRHCVNRVVVAAMSAEEMSLSSLSKQPAEAEATETKANLRKTHVEPKRVVDRRGLGILLVLLGALSLTLVDASAKWLLRDGMPPGQIVFIRFVFPAFMLVITFMPRHGVGVMRTRSIKLELARSFCMLGTTVTNFLALQYLPLTITGSIIFTSPLILCLLSGIALGERVDLQRWLAVLVGFIAVVIIIHPTPQSLHPAMLYSLAMAVLLALYAIFTRKLAGVDSSLTQQFYATFSGLAVSLPFAFQEWVWPQSMESWFVCALIGTVGLLGHTLYTIAHRMAPATTLAPFTYTQLIYMAAISWLIFGQGPDLYFFIGLPLLIGSGLFIWFRELQIATRGRGISARAGKLHAHE